MKRNTALLRKLRQVSEETREAVLADVRKTNQSKVGRVAGGPTPHVDQGGGHAA